MADLIDILIIAACLWLCSFIFSQQIEHSFNEMHKSFLSDLPPILMLLFFLVFLPIALIIIVTNLFCVFLIFSLSLLPIIIIQRRMLFLRGQTIGKMILGIKIVMQGTFQKAVHKNIITLRTTLHGFLCCVPVVGWIYWLIDKFFIFGRSRQCLHDKIAKTVVIKK